MHGFFLLRHNEADRRPVMLLFRSSPSPAALLILSLSHSLWHTMTRIPSAAISHPLGASPRPQTEDTHSQLLLLLLLSSAAVFVNHTSSRQHRSQRAFKVSGEGRAAAEGLSVDTEKSPAAQKLCDVSVESSVSLGDASSSSKLDSSSGPLSRPAV